MPKLYEYFGLAILFFANDHLPIHIHAKGQSGACKVEFIFRNGKLVEFRIIPVENKKLPSPAELHKLKELLRHVYPDIVRKWGEFYVEKKKIKPIKITKRLK